MAMTHVELVLGQQCFVWQRRILALSEIIGHTGPNRKGSVSEFLMAIQPFCTRS